MLVHFPWILWFLFITYRFTYFFEFFATEPALLYYQKGDYEKALQFYQRALEIYETVLGPQHPDVATALNNLALLYHQTGDYEKVLLLQQRIENNSNYPKQ